MLATLEDYIDGYLQRVREFIHREHKLDRITLLGICEGGSPSAMPRCTRTGSEPGVTITPIDFHADQAEGRTDHGLINLWTRSLTKEDIDRLIEANGNLPGELMSYVFSLMTPLASLTKYNVGMLDAIDDEKKLMNFLRMENGSSTGRIIRAKPPGMAEGSLQDNAAEGTSPRAGARRSRQYHDAGVEHLRQGRPHHSTKVLAGTGRLCGHRGLQRDRAARRPRGRVRERQVAGRTRGRHRRLAAKAA
jgi:hypothetical protein